MTLAVVRVELDAPPPGPFDAAILPPAVGTSSLTPLAPALRTWLLARHAEGTVLASVCVGAFHLAGIGVLDGRPATTHWAAGEALAEQFPAVHLDTDRILIDDGDVITAGGVMAWLDLALALVARLLGPSVAMGVSRFLLVDPVGREHILAKLHEHHNRVGLGG